MQNLKVTLIQTHQYWEDKAKNLAHFEALLSEVHDTDLILLPEMFQTGFTMNAHDLTEEISNSYSIRWLFERAIEKNAAIYTSLIIEENGSFYNRGIFVQPDGTVDYYNKRKLFGMANEHEYYTAGEKEQIIHWRGWNLNLQICYDLRFPEIVRNELIGGAPKYDAILYVANWPERRSHHWKTLLCARAIENQCYVIGVNRVGTDAHDLTYSGDSGVYNVLGEEVASLPPSETSVKTILLDRMNLTELRLKLPFLKDR